MGMLTDIFVATRSQIDAALLQNGPQPPLAVLESKGIDPLVIASLATIFLDEDLDDADAVVDRCPTCEMDAGAEGPWIYAISEEVTRSLAQLDDRSRSEVSRHLARTEELSHWSEVEFHEWFKMFADLAAIAVRQNRSLWIWICL